MPSLAVKLVATRSASTSSGTEFVDWATINVTYTPLPETSPGLELYGFAISGPGSGDTIEHVTVAVTEHQSDAAQAACTFELWDYSGTAAQIGTTQTGTASTSGSNVSTATFTGVTYAMLATLRVRVYGNADSGSGYIESVDGVTLTVSYMAGSATNATVTLGSALAVTTRAPAVLRFGDGRPAVLAAATANPPPPSPGLSPRSC